jgi:uncharacterized membrane protein YgdD (TMEM256/DUF423 family)
MVKGIANAYGVDVSRALAACLAVAAGAFGAHALEARLTPERLSTWELAARYQLFHALALLAFAWAAAEWPRFPAALGGGLLLAGLVIFCGTLYALALGAPRWLGAVTPVGGVLLLAAWLSAAVGALRG